jgi:hypothetical protein
MTHRKQIGDRGMGSGGDGGGFLESRTSTLSGSGAVIVVLPIRCELGCQGCSQLH